MNPQQPSANNTRPPGPIRTPGGTATRIPPGLQAKMAAIASRAAQMNSPGGPAFPSFPGQLPQHTPGRLPQPGSQPRPPPDVDGATRMLSGASISTSSRGPIPPDPRQHQPSPVPNGMRPPLGGLAKRARPGFKLSDITGDNGESHERERGPPSGIGGGGAHGAGLGLGRPSFQPQRPVASKPPQGILGTPFANFGKIVDPSGALNFNGKAILHSSGVDFSNGASFSINMTELELEEELGQGNYGTVKKVFHKPTKVTMAMKEIRLELDSAKLNAIIMELDILHRAVAPEIVEFYGAFFIESCVYYCMEYMDAGSLDTLIGIKDDDLIQQEEAMEREENGGEEVVMPDGELIRRGGPAYGGVPEDVLARITGAMVRGLKFLKDELQVMHRDVKPTNVLVNKKGQIKLCDFGVSGQLERSLAKTNIGCQSYMAPERIKGESINNIGTYTVSSDVWSLGLSIIELAMGQYPYPPETYSNVFAQLTAIVHGPPPMMPARGYSREALDFVDKCLMKEPKMRATYGELLEHPWLVADREREVDMAGWVASAMAKRKSRTEAPPTKPADPPVADVA